MAQPCGLMLGFALYLVNCHLNSSCIAFSALTLLVGLQEGHPVCKKTECWGAGMVIWLERGAHLHIAQLMPVPLSVSCFSRIQIGFTFLVPAHLGKRVCVCAVGRCHQLCFRHRAAVQKWL